MELRRWPRGINAYKKREQEVAIAVYGLEHLCLSEAQYLPQRRQPRGPDFIFHISYLAEHSGVSREDYTSLATAKRSEDGYLIRINYLYGEQSVS